MGAVLGVASLGSAVACCCGSAAVSLCCSACPSCKNSTSARIMYALILLLTTVVSCVFLSPKIENEVQKLKWLCDKVCPIYKLILLLLYNLFLGRGVINFVTF